LVGFLAGGLVCLILPLLRSHPLAEVTLTIAIAYLAFILGDHYFDVSGVFAAVTAGLVLSYQARGRISLSSWQRLSGSWEQLGFWASSLIFLTAAMIAPRMLADVHATDLVLLAILVLAAFAARAVTIFGLLPLLTAARLAERVETSYKIVILWGGMRGAVSLALALAVTEDEAVPADIRRFVAILTTGFVLFTLLVNAPSLRPLMRFLRLDRPSPDESALRERVIAIARSEATLGSHPRGRRNRSQPRARRRPPGSGRNPCRDDRRSCRFADEPRSRCPALFQLAHSQRKRATALSLPFRTSLGLAQRSRRSHHENGETPGQH
jgi:CPA1 family monovalent cation:H+ antiporter